MQLCYFHNKPPDEDEWQTCVLTTTKMFKYRILQIFVPSAIFYSQIYFGDYQIVQTSLHVFYVSRATVAQCNHPETVLIRQSFTVFEISYC